MYSPAAAALAVELILGPSADDSFSIREYRVCLDMFDLILLNNDEGQSLVPHSAVPPLP
jgi:hypothetical protein